MFSQVRQCTRCQRFGHKKDNCKSAKAFCFKCGELEHEGQCAKLKCFNCKKEHRAIIAKHMLLEINKHSWPNPFLSALDSIENHGTVFYYNIECL